MQDKHIVEELAFKLFYDSHTMWTEFERSKYWEDDRNLGERVHYLNLAEIALRYFKSIYYQL